jgi:uncharacterized protein YjdB
MRKKLFAATLAVLLIAVNIATVAGATTVTLSKLILSTGDVTMEIGDTYKLTATGIYSDDSTENLTVYADWSSENASIASIYNGTITAKAEGTTTIVVAYDGYTQSSNVTVTKKVKALTKNTQQLDLRKDGTATIGLTATYSDNTTENVSDKADWTSSNENVATVVNGKVTGLSSGTATITAIYGSKAVSVETNVEIVNRVEASDSQVSLLLQGAQTVKLTATYPDGTTKDVTSDAQWSSSDDDIAGVLKGVIKGYGSGTATITATYGTKSTTIAVDVDKTTKLDVDEESVFLHVMGTKQLKLTAQNADGLTSDVTNSATWTSNNESVAYVNKGLITGYKSGSATITATYNGKTVTIAVDVDVARLLEISDNKISMNSGKTATVTLKATYADGTTETVTSKATWSSDHENIAFASKGTITAYESGTAVISGAYGGKTTSVTVSVDVPTELTTSSKEVYMEAGAKYQADAIAVYSDDTEVAVTEDAVWSSSDKTVAEVANGIITGVASGIASITATFGGETVTLQVSVAVAKRVEASKTQVSLILKGTQAITLTATYADGSTKDVTSLATWSSSNEDVADAVKGTITGYGAGSAAITATYGTKSTTIKVDVDKTSKLDVSEQSVFLQLNGTKQLKLTVEYADGRTSDVTDTAEWSSSDESIAYVNKGLVTGYKFGTATVTAKFNGKTVQTTVDVETARNLDVNPDKVEMNAGDTTGVTLKATYADGTTKDVTAVADWSSTDEDVALVTDGIIKAYKMGSATIKGTYGGKTAEVAVSVDLPTKLTVVSKTVNLNVDEEHQTVLTAHYSDGHTEVVTGDATWSSADEETANVKDGLIMGITEGKTTVTATYGSYSVKITVNVGQADQLEPSTRLVTLSVSDSEQITLTATDLDGVSKDVTDDAIWKSSKTSVADVKKGLVKAYAKGTATITATYGGQSVTISVQVDQLTKIEASEMSVSLKSAGTATVTVTVTFSDGKTKDVTSLAEWTTTSYKVATVKNGKITAMDAGKTTVSAKYAGKTVKVAVDVDTLKYFETSEVSLALKVGDQVKVTALATYADETEADVSKPSLWVSSKITVVTAKNGVIKATGKGNATITITYAGKKTKIVVVVT